ncbi:hypothetical protein ACH4ZX_18900 [Streptomyces sp. NPDC020490]|uniref:hypothetical protein n=1 Tax=Streptomyces sp. NPDC020490 TaxID=3365078 RepID=UPI0037B5D4E1
MKTAARISMVATAGIAMAATSTTASATSGNLYMPRDMAAAVDMARTHADRMHVDQFDESFQVHEFGPLVAVTANNRATAESAGCSPLDPCRSVALSYQIVTTAGRNARLINATNISRAVNYHCDSCQTFSGAYQFVVATPQKLTLSSATRGRLDDIHREVAALRASNLSISEVQRRADALAQQVKTILDREVASAPRTASGDPLADFIPTVTLHRHVA